jgi:hypothetical protein
MRTSSAWRLAACADSGYTRAAGHFASRALMTSFSFADRKRFALSASRYWYGLRPRVNTPRSSRRPAPAAVLNTRSPDTGSFLERITTSTRCALGVLKASSFFTSGKATPSRAGTLRRANCSAM